MAGYFRNLMVYDSGYASDNNLITHREQCLKLNCQMLLNIIYWESANS